MTLVDDIRYVLDTVDTPPERVHSREVWHDETGGSLLHAPAWSGEFRDLIEGSPFRERVVRGQAPCDHPTLSADELASGASCPTCHNSGRRPRTEHRYRRPQHAADQRLARDRVPEGLPRFDVVLRAVRQCQGDVEATSKLLARTWPRMGAPTIAVRHIAEACRRYRRVFRDEPRGRMLRPNIERSESQLDAEVAA
jgi:hypothetical protein